ncbi:MAG TPA: ABC transporter permease [Pyrinomonadaceae bacterium]
MRNLIKDVRYGARALARRPGFALVAVVTLALGIGANTSIFSAVNAILLRPLPGVGDADALALVYPTEAGGRLSGTFSYGHFRRYAEHSKTFESMAAYSGNSLTLREGGRAEHVAAQLVSGNYFSTLGVRAEHGRLFAAGDDEGGAPEPSVVLGHRFWARRFGADPSVVGRQIVLNERAFTVVGVASKEFQGTSLPKSPALWVPLRAAAAAGIRTSDLSNDKSSWLQVVGRVRPGVGREQARAELDAMLARLAADYSESYRAGLRMEIAPARGFAIAPRKRGAVGAMAGVALAVVGLVLLIACANIANLMLARGLERRKEIAVRLALGASRWRIVRQLLAESLLLALAGGAVASLLTLWTSDLLAQLFHLIPEDTSALDFAPDARVFGFAFGLSLLTGVAFGLAPALRSSRPDLLPALKDERATDGGRGRKFTLRGALVVAQVAGSLVLLVGAGLFLRSLREAATVETGFETRGVLLSHLYIDPSRQDKARGQEFYRRALERASALPGVRSAALTSAVPLGSRGVRATLLIEGAEPQPYAGVEVDRAYVGARYFETMGITLLRGRGFAEQDGEGAPPVAVINETVARRAFGDANPVGLHVRTDSDGPPVEIVGVVADSKYRSLGDERVPFLYLPLAQNYWPDATLLVRTEGDPAALAPAVRVVVESLDAEALAGQATMGEHLAAALVPSQVAAGLFGVFGLLALALATFGVYGVVAYTVSRRTHEIGVRMALGARAPDVVRLVLFEGMTLVAVGLGVGLLLALVGTRAVEGALYGVSATDPATFACVTLLLACAALAACLVPARRATKVDPMVALRYE